MRTELSKAYIGTGEFEINYPGDSIEALIALLNALHKAAIGNIEDFSDKVCEPKCPAHKVFEILVEETVVCECGSFSKSKWDFSTFAHHFYVHEIFEDIEKINKFALLLVNDKDIVKSIEASTVMKCESRLQEYIRRQWESASFEMCPKECKRPNSHKVLELLNSPKVFMVNLIWKDFGPNLLKILQVLASVPYCISMDSIYNHESSTVHVLRSAIFYGAGHYICAIRNASSGIWYKIDDEQGKEVGTWEDLVFDSLKCKFYPVGLFYHESRNREENGISAQKWVYIERLVLNHLKKNNENDEENKTWTCKCGRSNDESWKVCNQCNQIKPGVAGWVCKYCTFINENIHQICKSCKKGNFEKPLKTDTITRPTIKKNKKWQCMCGTENDQGLQKCQCGLEKRCKICRKIIKDDCSDCYTANECVVCNEYIPKKDKKICFQCKTKTEGWCENCTLKISPNMYICENCTELLKQCGNCNKFRMPNAPNCTNISCKVTSEIPTEKRMSLINENCSTCLKSNRKCTCLSEIVCSMCSNKVPKIDGKICYKCQNDPSKKCKFCKKNTPTENFICKGCLKLLKKCPICEYSSVNSVMCENPECNSVETEEKLTENAKNFENVRPHNNIAVCKICDSELSNAFGFCLDCKLKINTKNCPFCKSIICRNLCEECIRSSRECKFCKHRNHISETQCLNCSNNKLA